MAIALLSSTIDAVKIYAAGSTVTRIAELRLTSDSLPEQVEIPGLPLALDDTSVRVWVEIDRGVPIAVDIRIGLAVPPPSEIPNPAPDEELRAATVEVQRLEDTIALINNEIAVLSGLEVPNRPEGESGKAPPPSPMSARLALANFSDEQIRNRMQEKREILEMLRQAKENLADLQQKQKLAATARDARPNELRKTAIVSLSYEGEFNTEQQTRLFIEYFVPGAGWTPTYVCRLDSGNSTANIGVRALICQQTGEDWSGVKLELSTALPMSWCALPELPSLRLGKAQPVVKKTGWRRPPIGAEILFEDYDRQKKMALAGVRKESAIADFSAPFLPSLPSLLLRQSVSGVEVITHNRPLQKRSSKTGETPIPQELLERSNRLPQKTNSKAGSTSLIALNFSPFGNKVVASGYVNPDQMHQAIIQSRKSGRPLTEVLESLTGRQLPPELLRQYKTQQMFELKILYGVKSLDPEINQIPTEQVNELIENLIPVDICRHYNLLPLAKNDTQPPSVLVAMVNPDNLQAQDDLNRILRPQGIELQRMVITIDDYQQLINGYLNELVDKQRKQEIAAKTDVTSDLEGLDVPDWEWNKQLK